MQNAGDHRWKSGGAWDIRPQLVPAEVPWELPLWPDLVEREAIMNFDHLGPQCHTPSFSPEPVESLRQAPSQFRVRINWWGRWGAPGGVWGDDLDGVVGPGLSEEPARRDPGKDIAASRFLLQLGLADSQPEQKAGAQPSHCLHSPL